MGDSAATASADGEPSAESSKADDARFRRVEVADKGDILLDVTFETSQDTLKKSRKAALAASRKANGYTSSATTRTLLPVVTVSYRVSLGVLKRHSQYFSNLLTNAQFRESKIIADVYASLAARHVKPGEADAVDLPRVGIVDDDEATQTAAREQIFEDMLRIMHQKPANTTRIVMSYVTTLAVIADRFDCVGVISRALNTEMKFKWPATNTKPMVDDVGRATDTEKILRQKILVAWLLGQAMRLHQASRELIMRGSRVWGPYSDDEAISNEMSATWWNLPEGLEEELQFRRECILNTVASVQRHFLGLYGSRERQCKLGYDSSAACDSFQLGQMLKFLVGKGLLFLVDFSTSSLDTLPDTSLLDLDELLSTLKQCPNYQVDKHHTNCGLRIRIDPILDYIRSMLSANVTSIAHADWMRRRSEVSWQLKDNVNKRANSGGHDALTGGKHEFEFTRALANDQRLRYEGAIYVDRMARALFTADAWNWTPEA